MKKLVVTSDRMVRVGLIEKVVLEQRLEEELTLDCVETVTPGGRNSTYEDPQNMFMFKKQQGG